VAAPTKEEAEEVAARLSAHWPKIAFTVEEDWSTDIIYVRAVSDSGQMPEFSSVLPGDWIQGKWRSPDQRNPFCAINKAL